jgi:hypothetical protein
MNPLSWIEWQRGTPILLIETLSTPFESATQAKNRWYQDAGRVC